MAAEMRDLPGYSDGKPVSITLWPTGKLQTSSRGTAAQLPY